MTTLQSAIAAAVTAGDEWISLTPEATQRYRTELAGYRAGGPTAVEMLGDMWAMARIRACETGKRCRVLASDGVLLATVEPAT